MPAERLDGGSLKAVNEGLISDSDVQRHARWNSIEMLYRYRCQTLENQRLVEFY